MENRKKMTSLDYIENIHLKIVELLNYYKL